MGNNNQKKPRQIIDANTEKRIVVAVQKLETAIGLIENSSHPVEIKARAIEKLKDKIHTLQSAIE
jgi:hypothetical protein